LLPADCTLSAISELPAAVLLLREACLRWHGGISVE
jgi:hypothetical protein